MSTTHATGWCGTGGGFTGLLGECGSRCARVMAGEGDYAEKISYCTAEEQMEDEVTPFAGGRSPDMMMSTPVPKGIMASEQAGEFVPLAAEIPKGILSETRRGAGSGASPWKQVKFHSTLPEGFPERLTQQGKAFTQRGGDLRGINLLLLVLACIWLARLLFVFTKAVSNMMHEEF